jgi:hypothetical protein
MTVKVGSVALRPLGAEVFVAAAHWQQSGV